MCRHEAVTSKFAKKARNIYTYLKLTFVAKHTYWIKMNGDMCNIPDRNTTARRKSCNVGRQLPNRHHDSSLLNRSESSDDWYICCNGHTLRHACRKSLNTWRLSKKEAHNTTEQTSVWVKIRLCIKGGLQEAHPDICFWLKKIHRCPVWRRELNSPFNEAWNDGLREINNSFSLCILRKDANLHRMEQSCETTAIKGGKLIFWSDSGVW